MFFHVPFNLELLSTNVTGITSYKCLFMCKRHLKHINVKCVENVSRKDIESQNSCKKSTSIFWFPVPDIKMPNIFYKIQKFLRITWASIISHKNLLHLIIWMLTALKPFPPNLQDTINPKPLELESWNFERMFTPNHVSHVRCQVTGVRCQVSSVRFFSSFFRTKLWSKSVEGLLSTGLTLSNI